MVLLRGVGDAEIDDLDDAVVGDEQIVGRDVAVHDVEQLALHVAQLVRRV